MLGFHVTGLTHGAETTAIWSYDGALRIKPEPLRWKPGGRDADHAANLALSVLLPIAVAAGEGVELPYAIPQSTYDFWSAKFRSLGRFYKRPPVVNLSPISGPEPVDYVGEDVGLCWGGGVDSMATLCHHKAAGASLRLVSLREIGQTPPLTVRCLTDAANAAHAPLTFVDTNANKMLGRYSRLVADRIVADDPFFFEFMPPAGAPSVLPYVFTRGFVFFFAALCGLPSSVRDIIYSYACGPGMDYGESHANGFSFYDDTPYRGCRLVPFSAGSRVEMIRLAFVKHPEIAKHMKACPSGKRQWCGNCIKCAVVHLAQRVLGLPPIPLQKGSLKRRLPLYQVSSLLAYYRREPNADEEFETLLLKLLDRSASHGARGVR